MDHVGRLGQAGRATVAADLVLLGVSLALIYAASPFAIEGDGTARFEALSRLLGGRGLERTPYSMVGPLFSAPLWWIGMALGNPTWWVTRYNFILFVASLAGFYLILTPAIDRGTVVRFLLILTVGSMFPHHLGRYYGEVFTALLVGLGLALVCVRGAYWGWLLAVLGAANTPAIVPGLALVAIAWTWHTRDLRHLLPAAAAAMVMGESWLRRGGPLVTGYEGNRGAETILPFSGRPGFSYPFVLGVISILLSFGKGLLLFAPGLLAVPGLTAHRAPGAVRTALLFWSLLVAGLVLVYAKWWAWYGGEFWGPRFFLFGSIPAALALATWSSTRRASAPGRAAVALALLWSCWVGANGLVWRSYAAGVCSADHYAQEFLCWYVPEFSTLFGPLYRSRALESTSVIVLAWFAAVGLWLVWSSLRSPDSSLRSPVSPPDRSPQPNAQALSV